MTIFQNYIYENILNYIVYSIYNNDSIETYNNYSITNINNETINLSLVNKVWFNIIGNKLLPKYLNLDNLNILNPLIEHDNNNNYKHNNKKQKREMIQYKLINKFNSIKLYDQYNDFEHDLNNNNNQLNKYKKIIIEVNNNKDIITIFKSINKYPINSRFILYIDNDMNLNELLLLLLNNDNNKTINIKKIVINQTEWDRQSIYKLLNSNGIKGITYSSILNSNLNFTLHFIKSNNNQIININNLILPKQQQQHDNGNNKLNHLFLELNIQKLLLSTIHDGGIIFDTKEDFIKVAEQQWNQIINQLSNDKTLSHLNIAHSCKEYCNCEVYHHINTDTILNGFNQLISTSTSIKSLFFFIKKHDSNFYKSLSNNKSILNLLFTSVDLLNIINLVLINNKTIRNLYIITNDINHLLDSLLLLKDIDLYSITFELSISNLKLNQLLNIIKNNIFLIKEFIILNNNQSDIENDDESNGEGSESNESNDEDQYESNSEDQDESNESDDNDQDELSSDSESVQQSNLIYYTIQLNNAIIKVLTNNN